MSDSIIHKDFLNKNGTVYCDRNIKISPCLLTPGICDSLFIVLLVSGVSHKDLHQF